MYFRFFIKNKEDPLDIYLENRDEITIRTSLWITNSIEVEMLHEKDDSSLILEEFEKKLRLLPYEEVEKV